MYRDPTILSVYSKPLRCVYENKKLRFLFYDETPPDNCPVYSMWVELFFALNNSFLAFSDKILQLNKQPYYINISFPITYGDLAVAAYIGLGTSYFLEARLDQPLSLDYPWLHERGIFDFPPERVDKILHSRLLNVYTGKDSVLLTTNCLLYFLKQFYRRFCILTGCPYNQEVFRDFRRFLPKDPTQFSSMGYVDLKGRLVYTALFADKIIKKLFPNFWHDYLDYILEVPLSEALLNLKDDLGLRLWVAHCMLRK